MFHSKNKTKKPQDNKKTHQFQQEFLKIVITQTLPPAQVRSLEWENFSGKEISFPFVFRKRCHKLKDVVMEDLILGEILPLGQVCPLWSSKTLSCENWGTKWTFNTLGVTFGVKLGVLHVDLTCLENKVLSQEGVQYWKSFISLPDWALRDGNLYFPEWKSWINVPIHKHWNNLIRMTRSDSC